MKKKYSRFRELWAVPRYKTLIKFGSWMVFFLIIFILSALVGSSENIPPEVSDKITFSQMKTNLIASRLQVKYNITTPNNTYLIEGIIYDGILEGTVEMINDDRTEKVKITNENVYIIKKGITEATDLLSAINPVYLLPENIITIINQNIAVIKESDDKKVFSYNIDERSYSVYTNEEEIIKIIILDDLITYELAFSTF